MKTTSFILLGVHAVAVPFLFSFETSFALLFAAGFLLFVIRDLTRAYRPLDASAPIAEFPAGLDAGRPGSERLPHAA